MTYRKWGRELITAIMLGAALVLAGCAGQQDRLQQGLQGALVEQLGQRFALIVLQAPSQAGL